MPTTIKIKIYTVVFVLVFIFLPRFTFAAQIIASQYIGTSVTGSELMSDNGSPNWYQTLGTGFGGTLDQIAVQIRVNATVPANTTTEFTLEECTDGSYSSCTGYQMDDFDLSGMTAQDSIIFLTFGDFTSGVTQIDLLPSKYYRLKFSYDSGIETSQTFSNVQLLGSASNVYANGAASGTGVAPVADFYFYLSGAANVYDSSFVSNLSPANASTTASTLVNITFDYHAGTYPSVPSEYLISVVDVTTGHAFQALRGAVTSGTHSVSRYITLEYSHAYRHTVTVCSTDGTCMGSAQAFFAVGTTTGSTILDIYNPFVTSSTTIYYDEDGNAVLPDHASSTIGFIPSGLNALARLGPVGSALCTRFPFSYLCDMGTVIQELDQTSTTQVASFTFPLGAHMASGSTTFTMFDPSTIQSGGLISTIRTFLVYALWLMFAFAVFFRILAFF